MRDAQLKMFVSKMGMKVKLSDSDVKTIKKLWVENFEDRMHSLNELGVPDGVTHALHEDEDEHSSKPVGKKPKK